MIYLLQTAIAVPDPTARPGRSRSAHRIALLAGLGFGLAAAAASAQETTRQPAPLPAAARGPAVPQDKGYLVQEIRDSLFWVTDGVYQVMFLVRRDGVIAVDAPPNLGPKYLQAIRDVTSRPVTHVIYSHQHADHIGSAHLFPKNAKIIAHEKTAELLSRVNDPDRPKPTGTFGTATRSRSEDRCCGWSTRV